MAGPVTGSLSIPRISTKTMGVAVGVAVGVVSVLVGVRVPVGV